LDHIEASYKMAEEMEDPTSVTRRSQEPTNKQTPIIKGVLPDAPAPAAPVKPESAKPTASHSRAQTTVKTEPTGFFAWIKTLFASDASAQSNSAKPATQDASDSRGRNNRNGRDAGRDSGRNGRNGEGRGPRNEGRTDGRTEGRSEGRPEGRNTRGGRGGRGGQGGERQNPNQRERFDADGKAVGANVDVSQDGVDGNARQERAPRNDRGERNGRQGRTNERNETGDRSDERNNDTGNVSANPEGNTADREPRGRNGRNGNNRRNDRGPRQDDGTTPAQLDDSNSEPRDAAAPAETSDSREPRRSRDRYGRDRAQRGERGERPERGEHNEPNASDASTMPERTSFESEDSQEPIVVRASYFSQPAEVVIAPAPSPVTAPVVTAPATQAPSISAAPQAMPKVATYALPTGALEAVAQGSGLQWVNSDPQRIAAVQAAIASEPTPAHVPRERAAPVASTEGPLVLVETKRDLRTVPLGSQE
jgi:ribonuclease E